jgi:hypothetical protein
VYSSQALLLNLLYLGESPTFLPGGCVSCVFVIYLGFFQCIMKFARASPHLCFSISLFLLIFVATYAHSCKLASFCVVASSLRVGWISNLAHMIESAVWTISGLTCVSCVVLVVVGSFSFFLESAYSYRSIPILSFCLSTVKLTEGSSWLSVSFTFMSFLFSCVLVLSQY